MMQNDSPTPEVAEGGMDVSTPAQTDWPLKQVEELARELYIRKPFNPENKEACEALARQAFNFLDNMREVCEEILGTRSEWRATQAEVKARAAAAKHLPDIAPFEKAVRFITGAKRTDRALSNFDKALRYDARVELLDSPDLSFETTVLAKLPAEKKRRLENQLKIWQQNGVPCSEVLRLQSLFEYNWPGVVAEQNAKKARKKPKWSMARRLKSAKKQVGVDLT
jgi:hypothetical protein